jgi:hypothetical protein
VHQLLGHEESIVADERAACGTDSLLAIGRERDVRGACVAAVEGPFRLAVADDEASRRRHDGPLYVEEVLRRRGEGGTEMIKSALQLRRNGWKLHVHRFTLSKSSPSGIPTEKHE